MEEGEIIDEKEMEEYEEAYKTASEYIPQNEKAERLIFDAIVLDTEKKLREELQTELKINFELYNWDSISNSLVEYFAELFEYDKDEGSADNFRNTFGGNDAFGCDIILRNKDDKNEKIYIEVKSFYENKVDFYLTPNEYKFATKHPENYFIIHVRNMKEKEKEKWHVEVLPKKFWENKRWNMEEVIQNVWEDGIPVEKQRYFFSERI